MFNRYIEQSLKIFNYIDGMMIVDKEGTITYFYTAYPNISALDVSEVMGKKLLDVYPSLTEESSYIMRCLKTGQTFMNYQQTFTSFKGHTMHTTNSTLPIYHKDEIIGVADIVVYSNVEKRNITIDVDLDKILKPSREQSIYNLDDIVTSDPRMMEIKEKIRANTESQASVLVYGKTGTGKELIVNSIHKCSNRKDKPFITQNCAAIPSTLLESILFGTVKGSFTGAHDREGLFEMADGGTLFLDEINSMELNAQAKILRAVEEQRIRRVGDTKSRKIDVRIVASVNEDPLECVRNQKLREDLYYRLCVIRYDIPSLCDRRGDIPLLMEYFRKYFNIHLNRNIKEYAENVHKIFLNYNWPGNVRELKNVIEASFQGNFGSVMQASDIPEYIRNASKDIITDITEDQSLTEMVETYEKEIIEKKMLEYGNNLSKTARALKITKQTLWYKVKKYGLGS